MEREGLGDERWRGRRARDWYGDQLATKIASVEWGLFLGAGHVIERDRLRGSFDRVEQLSSTVTYLQVTSDPEDDLSGVLEQRLPAAREALAPVRMDGSGVADVLETLGTEHRGVCAALSL